MLIRATTNSQHIDGSKSKMVFNGTVDKPLTASTTGPVATSKPPQNRYESIFIKLFAKTTLQLILSFSAIFFSIIFFRDLISTIKFVLLQCAYPLFLDLRINLFKFSFWFQLTLNLSLFVALIFAKMKCISSKKY